MQPDPTTMECGHYGMWPNQSLQSQGNAPIETEPMIKNTTHSSIGCNGMANNDDYHGLEMYKNHAKDSTTEGYMQPDPTNMECMWSNQSLKGQGNAPSECTQAGADDGTQQSSSASPQIASKRKLHHHNGWPQAWSAIGQPSNSWPPDIGKLRLRTTGHNVSHSCLKRLINRLSKHIAQWLPPAHPGSLAGHVCQASPMNPANIQAYEAMGAVSATTFEPFGCSH